MINVTIDGDPLEGVENKTERRDLVQSEVNLEVARFKEHWVSDLGMGDMHWVESTAVQTYILWKLSKK